MHLEFSSSAPDEWLSTRVVRVGVVPPHRPMPTRYVLLSTNGEPRLRVEVYSDPDEVHAFEDAEVWSDRVVIGFGERVHFVSCDGTNAACHVLESYFGHIYATPDYLLVASAEIVRRFDRGGGLLWSSERVGLDGVVVHDAGPPLVRGEGEWDPPGGWRPFALDAETGVVVRG